MMLSHVKGPKSNTRLASIFPYYGFLTSKSVSFFSCVVKFFDIKKKLHVYFYDKDIRSKNEPINTQKPYTEHARHRQLL